MSVFHVGDLVVKIVLVIAPVGTFLSFVRVHIQFGQIIYLTAVFNTIVTVTKETKLYAAWIELYPYYALT